MDERRTILLFAIGLSTVAMLFLFIAAFFVTSYTDKDSVKTILPFLFTSCGLLWGYYWGTGNKGEKKEDGVA